MLDHLKDRLCTTWLGPVFSDHLLNRALRSCFTPLLAFADSICDGIKGSIDEMQALDKQVVDLVQSMSTAPADNGAASPGAVHFP